MDSKRIIVEKELDVALACQEGRRLAQSMGFGTTAQACIATAISELATNLVFHTGGGIITLTVTERGGKLGLEVLCEDSGPGIEDVELAMQNGYSTRGGLGGGLPGVRRLMDEFEIQSQVGVGTRIVARKWL
jgi:serine/threonine-protein kinase RsbT